MPIGQSKNILLVEDEVLIAMMSCKKLEPMGYKVQHAVNGEDAIKMVNDKNNHFDLILMDINLGSGIDGTEAAKIILKDYNIPILFLSSHTEPEIVEKTEKITSYGYVVKDSKITVLDASIKMALKLFEANKIIIESEEKFRHAFEYSASGVCIVDLQGNFKKVNTVIMNMFGYSEEELLRYNFNDITYKEDLTIGSTFLEEMLNGQIHNATFEKRYLRKNGEILWGLVATSLIKDYNKKPQFFITYISDITDMKNAQMIIKKREDELQLALQVARIGYWRYDCLTQKVEWHHNHELLFGIKKDGFGGTLDDVQSMVYPDDREHGVENLRKTLTENVPFDNTYRVIHPDGKILWLHSYGYLYHDKDGNPDYIFGITQNITERKENGNNYQQTNKLSG